MASTSFTERLARSSTSHPWWVVGVWAILLAAGAFLGSSVGSVLTTNDRFYVEVEAERAERLVEDRLHGKEPAKEFVIVRSNHGTVDDAEYRDLADRLVADARATTGVAAAVSYYESRDPNLVSVDKATLLIPVILTGDIADAADTVEPLMATLERYDGQDGYTVLTGGDGSLNKAFSETAARDLEVAEIFGLPVALLVLVVVFGALVAAGVPLAMGLTSIAIAVGITAVVGRLFDLSTFTINMISMIGLAVGIDYSLIIIQRFREERRAGVARDDAIARTGATASRAVLFSGLAVVVALAGLIIVPSSVFRSLAAGAIIVVIVAIVAALTLLPAMLRLMGDRVNLGTIRLPGREREPGQGKLWSAAAGLVMNHAALSVVVSITILLAAALPYLNVKLGSAGISSLPHQTDAYRAFSILDSEFSGGLLTPTTIVVEAPNVNAPAVQDALAKLEMSLHDDADFGPVRRETNPAGDLVLVTVTTAGDAQNDRAIASLDRLRSDYIPAAFRSSGADVAVGGATAESVDYRAVIDRYTPVVFTFVLGLSFLILLLVFRSVVVPLKAIVMNLLSVGASYGIMTLVFQDGVGAGALGFQQVERIESWVPLFMFAVLFGLSMDYHVFLLTRIREHFDQTGDNRDSVRFGVQTTAGMITGAALIMVAVFSGFAMGELTMFQQMGFGLAVAVILDATIVRTVLVPASMSLLGKWNWYLPYWLDWLPNVHVEGPAAGPEHLSVCSLEPGR